MLSTEAMNEAVERANQGEPELVPASGVEPTAELEHAIELLEELGFDAVCLDEPGAPVPEHVSRRLACMVADLREALGRNDMQQCEAVCRQLDQLVVALRRYPEVLAHVSG